MLECERMNLVFFDIECASVYKTTAKICAFGYVICDEQFNIIKKEDILINPKGKFHLTDGRGEHGLVLPYEYENFKNYPLFPEVYPTIKQLLEDKNNVVYGHSILNDIKYLQLETNRFKLEPLNFDFSDSQIIYMTSIGDYSRQFGLEYITKDLNVEFTPHRAADDAYATMKIVEAMCKREGLTYLQLEEKLKIKKGNINGVKVTKPTSQGFIEYVTKREKDKQQRAKNRSQFYVFLSRKRAKKSGKLLGNTYTFSRNIEDNLNLSTSLVNSIYEKGGKYSQKLETCNVYVCEDNDISIRTKNAQESKNISILSLTKFRELLNND
jgi:DNA polymerase III epsilon subunit-like protein